MKGDTKPAPALCKIEQLRLVPGQRLTERRLPTGLVRYRTATREAG